MPKIFLLQAISQTPKRLGELINQQDGLSAESWDSQNRWKPSDLLNHLVYSEALFLIRFQTIVDVDIPSLSPFTADQQPLHEQTAIRTDEEINQQFRQAREKTIRYLTQLPPDAWEREAYHPDYGQASLHFHIQNMFTHDREHINQLQKIIDQNKELAPSLS